MLAALQQGNPRAAAEWAMCERDPIYLATRHAWIKLVGGRVALMNPLRLAQRKTASVVHYCRQRGIPARITIGKSRKQGESTWVEWDMFIEAMNKGIDALVLAHDKGSAEYIFGIMNRFYENFDQGDDALLIPGLVKPERFSSSNKKELRFSGREGLVQVETANNLMAGTGKTPQYVHWSEVAKCERASATALSLFQSIGDDPATTFIMESTFNGEDTLFYPYWQDAYQNSKLDFEETGEPLLKVNFEVTNSKRWNGWIPIFISVLDDATAKHSFTDDEDCRRFVDTLDAVERHLLEKASPEFLKWRRWAIPNKCQNTLWMFKQEFPTNPEEAVRGSGHHRFDLDKLEMMPVADPQMGSLTQEDAWMKRVVWVNDPGGIIRRWKTPVPGHRYVISADASEGIQREEDKDPDATVVHVYDKDFGGEQVASIEGQIHPEDLIRPLVLLAEYYNMAFIVPELNSMGAVICVDLSRLYPNERLYHSDDWDPTKSRMARGVGFKTSPTNRDDLISYLGDAINTSSIMFHDKATVHQCKKFVKSKRGKVEAAPGEHDDHVIAAALGVQGMRHYPHRLDDEAMLPRRLRPALPRTELVVDSVTGY